MESQVTDLMEKLETIKAKRLEDRNKLKEAEKQKILCEQVRYHTEHFEFMILIESTSVRHFVLLHVVYVPSDNNFCYNYSLF